MRFITVGQCLIPCKVPTCDWPTGISLCGFCGVCQSPGEHPIYEADVTEAALLAFLHNLKICSHHASLNFLFDQICRPKTSRRELEFEETYFPL